MVDSICEVCKKTFKTYPYRVRQGIRFCSSSCYGVKQRERRNSSEYKKSMSDRCKQNLPDNAICFGCGKSFRVFPYVLKTNKHTFCSFNCRIGITIEVSAKHLPRIKNGYRFVHAPNHHRRHKSNYAYEHVIIAERTLGRKLKKGEVVHHIDEDKLNNDPMNLYIFPSSSAHISFHQSPPHTKPKLLAIGATLR